MTEHRAPLDTAVRMAWHGADSTEEAADRLLAHMRDDAALYNILMAPHERRIVMEAVGSYRRRERATIWHHDPRPDQRVAALARVNTQSLLDMRLPSGRRLGDATHDDVVAAAEDYKARAGWNMEKSRFFAKVAKRTPQGKRVGDVLSAADLAKLR